MFDIQEIHLTPEMEKQIHSLQEMSKLSHQFLYEMMGIPDNLLDRSSDTFIREAVIDYAGRTQV